MIWIIKGNEIIWGPHEYPEAERDANSLVQPSLGEEVVTEFPPKGRVFENGNWREKTIKEKVLDGEISLSVRRAQLQSEIFRFSINKTEEGIFYLTYNFQAREEDLIRMNLVISKVSIGGVFGGAWRDRDNQWRAMTLEQLQGLAIAAGQYWEDCFRKSRVLIDGLIALSKADLADYDVSFAWEELP